MCEERMSHDNSAPIQPPPSLNSKIRRIRTESFFVKAQKSIVARAGTSAPARATFLTVRRVNPAPPSILASLLLGGLLLVSGPAKALKSDSSQPIYIEANSATYDERKGETVYVGDVKATQGSLEVHGDQMVVYDQKGKTENIRSVAQCHGCLLCRLLAFV